jgi:hypothetical protein
LNKNDNIQEQGQMEQQAETRGDSMSDEKKPDDVFSDWDLLRRIDKDLRNLAKALELPLHEVPYEFLHCITQDLGLLKKICDLSLDGLLNDFKGKENLLNFADRCSPFHENVSKLKNKVLREAQDRRAKEVEDICRAMRRKKVPKPESWQKLEERVFGVSSRLERYIRSRPICWLLRDDAQRDDVAQEALCQMHQFILRNAGQWYRRHLRDSAEQADQETEDE